MTNSGNLMISSGNPVEPHAHRAEPCPETTGPHPEDDDIVVCGSHSAVRFTVRQLPGVAQFGTPSRDFAIAVARCHAQRAAVDIWYMEDGTYRLLERYRSRN
jgi:hypothetical protein